MWSFRGCRLLPYLSGKCGEPQLQTMAPYLQFVRRLVTRLPQPTGLTGTAETWRGARTLFGKTLPNLPHSNSIKVQFRSALPTWRTNASRSFISTSIFTSRRWIACGSFTADNSGGNHSLRRLRLLDMPRRNPGHLEYCRKGQKLWSLYRRRRLSDQGAFDEPSRRFADPMSARFVFGSSAAYLGVMVAGARR